MKKSNTEDVTIPVFRPNHNKAGSQEQKLEAVEMHENSMSYF
jgi:hypothetical protein